MTLLGDPFYPAGVESLPANIATAVEFSTAGAPVFPCDDKPDPKKPGAPSKKPLVHGSWKEAATNNPDALASLFGHRPTALVGLPCGENGLLVIDCDRRPGKPDGVAAFATLVEQYGLPEGVVIVQTQSGGLHYYFRQPDDSIFGNSTGRLPAGVDVRGDGGFTIAPGSFLTDGRGWREVEGSPKLIDALKAGQLPVAPDWLLTLLRGSKTAAERDDSYDGLITAFASEKPLSERARASGPAIETRPAFDDDDAEVEWRFIEEAVSFISSDDRDTWLTVGGALHDKFGNRGRLLWDAWSRSSSKFDAADQSKTWASFSRPYSGSRATIGTVVAMARESGFAGRKFDYAPKQEIPDWIRNGEGFIGAAQSQPRESSQAKPGKVVLKTVFASSLAGLPVPQSEWAIRNMIPANNVALLYGDGSTGKSLLALQLAVAASDPDYGLRKATWLNETPIYGKSVFVSAEDEIDEVHRRLAKIEPNLALLKNLVIVPLAGEDAILAAPEGRDGLLKETPIFRALKDILTLHKPVLMVLDTLADLFGGDEIKKVHARQFISMLRGLAFNHKCTIVLLAHPSQSGMSSGDGTSGNVAWNNSVRSRLYFERVITRVDGRAVEEDKDLRVLSVKKSNRGPRPSDIFVRWKDGQFVREARAEETHTPADHARVDNLFLSLLAQFAKEKRDVSPKPSNTYAPKMFARHARSGKVDARQFAAAMDRLLESGRIEIEIFGPPSKQRSRIVIKEVSSDTPTCTHEGVDTDVLGGDE